ncbi:LysR substrate-binding domain-containing protein [Streptoalloteichus hindustanus]|uniref:DNA-binding transcriptional regulator, LysR family n=1 Tax=Streptoalloteichus hindustanus TaxID=2017 RepID=A0A1M5KTH4_STRHI|nr:LysR substrate-binding domain-containing protein [Streptoalloteichus hindustanus]SHG56045.1 DNA-binding transcriptional regulator, LysR family [Streptoalloteichus hindustanus]
MAPVLDIVPLRSLVAVADCGGFHRAAAALHLTQSAVSQHVRRLERVLGRPVVRREGRRFRFTPTGEALLAEARRLLSVHDEMIRRLDVERPGTLVVGSTEYAADQLLPELAAALRHALPGAEVRFRLDHSARLAEAVEQGVVDLAVLLGGPTGGRTRAAGVLPLAWFAAPDWRPLPGRPLPVVAYHEPCVLRRIAVETLTAAGIPLDVVVEAADLAGVQAAARAGLGVTLLPAGSRRPEGLAPWSELPPVPLRPLRVRVRRGLPVDLARDAAAAVRVALGTAGRHPVETPAAAVR